MVFVDDFALLVSNNYIIKTIFGMYYPLIVFLPSPAFNRVRNRDTAKGVNNSDPCLGGLAIGAVRHAHRRGRLAINSSEY